MVGTWFVNFGPNTKHGYGLKESEPEYITFYT
jgi:hypothetical protein